MISPAMVLELSASLASPTPHAAQSESAGGDDGRSALFITS